jgi:hypothetical protein
LIASKYAVTTPIGSNTTGVTDGPGDADDTDDTDDSDGTGDADVGSSDVLGDGPGGEPPG